MLTPIVKGPFVGTKVDKQCKTVVMEHPDRITENVSHDHVSLEPKTKNKADLMNKAEPMKLIEIIYD